MKPIKKGRAVTRPENKRTPVRYRNSQLRQLFSHQQHHFKVKPIWRNQK